MDPFEIGERSRALDRPLIAIVANEMTFLITILALFVALFGVAVHQHLQGFQHVQSNVSRSPRPMSWRSDGAMSARLAYATMDPAIRLFRPITADHRLEIVLRPPVERRFLKEENRYSKPRRNNVFKGSLPHISSPVDRTVHACNIVPGDLKYMYTVS